MNRKKTAALGLIVLLTAVAGTSYALTGEHDFISGYDEENDVLVYGFSETDDATIGCEALDGTTVSYATTTTTTGPGGGCELRVVEVANENGVVNHGQVVSSFVHDLKEAGVEGGIGCLVREIAHSDHGKKDDGATTTTIAASPTAEVDLSLATITCGSLDRAESEDEAGGRPDHAGQPEDKGKGRPDHAGPPDHAGQNGNGPKG
ncbi:MAG: hypothetical protein ABR609_13750 [Acidimicrobiia bacterium]